MKLRWLLEFHFRDVVDEMEYDGLIWWRLFWPEMVFVIEGSKVAFEGETEVVEIVWNCCCSVWLVRLEKTSVYEGS